MDLPPVVSQDEWQAARDELLAKEKEATRARTRSPPSAAGCRGSASRRTTSSRARAARRAARPVRGAPPAAPLPLHVRPEPGRGLRRLLDVRRPNRPPRAPARARHDSFALVSRAPLAKIEPYRKRMGWTIPWYSSFGATSTSTSASRPETPQPGISTRTARRSASASFLRDGDSVFRTYFTTTPRRRGARQRLDASST